MLIVKLRIDGQVFYPTAETDIPALKQRIIEGVKTGAEFVDFDTHGHGQVSVLMTQLIPVRFETVERTAEEVQSWESEPPSFDFDTHDLYD